MRRHGNDRRTVIARIGWLPAGRLPAPLAKKLEAHDLAGMPDLLPRNLAALFNIAE